MRLRAQAVSAARQCEADGTFAPSFAQHFARLLGLSTQREHQQRIAGMAIEKINKKQASKAAAARYLLKLSSVSFFFSVPIFFFRVYTFHISKFKKKIAFFFFLSPWLLFFRELVGYTC